MCVVPFFQVPYVAFGSLTDLPTNPRDVRFAPSHIPAFAVLQHLVRFGLWPRAERSLACVNYWSPIRILPMTSKSTPIMDQRNIPASPRYLEGVTQYV